MKVAFAGIAALAAGATAAVATWLVGSQVVPVECMPTRVGCLYDFSDLVVAGSIGWVVAAVAFLALRQRGA